MTLSVMDWFCGAGGSSQGIHSVPGVAVMLAANHWELALRTHAENFPQVRHEIGDIRELDVQDWPVTEGFWASPECTRFSAAQGVPQRWSRQDVALPGMEPEIDAAADRSRALMWDVPKYLDGVQRRGKLVLFGVVENVVEIGRSPQWEAWKAAMRGLGYKLKVIAFNSMHAQATTNQECPQSRNRAYVAYWHRSLKRNPDFDKWLRPRAHCKSCSETVNALQSWNRPGVELGSYGRRRQYIYRCPKTSCRGQEVIPPTLPAAAAIDWDITAPRIGDRPQTPAKPEGLRPATIARIRAGMAKHWEPLLVPSGGTWRKNAMPLTTPMPARTTRENDGIALPELLVPLEGRDGKRAAPATDPMRTQTGRRETGLVLPPVMVTMRGGGSRTASSLPEVEPMGAVSAGGNHHGLIQPPLLVPYYSTSTTNTPLQSVPADVDIAEVRFRMLEPSEVARGMAFQSDYIVLGSKRDKVRQYGNAVTPCVSELLISALSEAVTGEDLERKEFQVTTAA